MPDPGHCSDQEAETNRQLTTMNRILTPFTPSATTPSRTARRSSGSPAFSIIAEQVFSCTEPGSAPSSDPGSAPS